MGNTKYNSYFIDCDAFGESLDDYSPLHKATQEDDYKERVRRMKWISDTYNMVIGSEGGSSFAAPVIHVAEGMTSQPYGKWNDPDFANRESEYFLGRHYPLHGPEIFLKEVPLKEKFVYSKYDPRFRLPLNEIVFHDSFVSTNHYGSGNLKFSNIQETVELTSLLYMTPAIYHFNLKEFKKNKEYIIDNYNFFSPIHKEIGFDQMTDFAWLTDDHMVQKTIFGAKVEMIANFKDKAFNYEGTEIPALSIMAKYIKGNKVIIYSSNQL